LNLGWKGHAGYGWLAWNCGMGGLVWLVPMVFLWQALIRHLSVEWTLNPSYNYGWAVPALCGYLIWRDLRDRLSEPRGRGFTLAGLLDRRTAIAGGVLMLCYAPLRLIQEANPDWRLVSWGLALEVLGLTLLLVSWLIQFCARARCEGLRFPSSLFPFLFFLTAVPWPTVIESRVIRVLAALITLATTEILGVFGVPALLHGNIIEVGGGRVSIQEGCSGIRSFQSSMMVALFFGQVYQLSWPRRFLCVVAGGTLSVLMNLVRAVVLTLLTGKGGANLMKEWHESGGIPILVTVFLGVSLLALCLRPKPPLPSSDSIGGSSRAVRESSSQISSGWAGSVYLPVGLMVWLGLVEAFNETWYRRHEDRFQTPMVWGVEAPRTTGGFQELPLSQSARQYLRFDKGWNTTWLTAEGMRWQAIYLSWRGGGIATQLARNHTPEDCLVAGGYELSADSRECAVSVKGLELLFRSYIARGDNGPVHVFYCLWQERVGCRLVEASWLTYRNRLTSVIMGQRNAGQRSLELAVWGAHTQDEARHALGEALEHIITVGN
jgi:exosortase